MPEYARGRPGPRHGHCPSGTSVVYQDRGLLPPPRREGRVAYYNDDHVARLRLVGRLLDRGYTLAHHQGAVRRLVRRPRPGGRARACEGAISAPWTDEIPTYVTAAEIRDRFGPGTTPSVVERAVALGLLEPSGLGVPGAEPQAVRGRGRPGRDRRAGLAGAGPVRGARSRDLAVVAQRLFAGGRRSRGPSGQPRPDAAVRPGARGRRADREAAPPCPGAPPEALLARALTAETDRLFRRSGLTSVRQVEVRPVEHTGDANAPDARP